MTYDVPCVTVLGDRVCSSWADAAVDLGGLSGATMDATLGLTYTPRKAGDWVTIEARVLTNQVDGGVGFAGAGIAPVHVYADATDAGSQEADRRVPT